MMVSSGIALDGEEFRDSEIYTSQVYHGVRTVTVKVRVADQMQMVQMEQTVLEAPNQELEQTEHQVLHQVLALLLLQP